MSFLFGALCLQSSQRFPKMLGQRKVHAHPEHANERSGRRAAPSLTPSLWPSLSPHSQVDAAFVQRCAYLRDASRAHPSFGAVHTCLYPIGPLPLTERRLAYPHQNPLQVPSFVEPSGHSGASEKNSSRQAWRMYTHMSPLTPRPQCCRTGRRRSHEKVRLFRDALHSPPPRQH